jgi:pimeloyl-ACP methyl ester carboxylesterase
MSARLSRFIPAVIAGLSYRFMNEGVIRESRWDFSRWSKLRAIGNTRVHYLDVGRTEPDSALLIVHGYLGSTVSFLDLIDILSPDLRVVMPDLPQIGKSVLILIGSEDKLLCAEDSDKFRQLLAREQQEIVEDSGHFLYLDSPDIVAQKIATFTRGGKE